MLILTRRIGETIRIGDEIQISVLAIHGHQVRIGISAPEDIKIFREEIFNRIQEEEIKQRNLKQINKTRRK